MKDIVDLAELIREYGPTLYGNEAPEEIALQWSEALPGVSLSHFQSWFDCGFWSPSVVRELFSNGFYPWDIPDNIVYDLCNGDLPVSIFLQARKN